MKRKLITHHVLILLTLIMVLACIMPANALAKDPVEIRLWYHGGTADENEETRAQVNRFNAMQNDVRVKFIELAGSLVAGSGYNDAVNAAAVAGDLPCILDLDGPNLYNYAWAGFLVPLEGFMSYELGTDMLPSLIDQGTYNGRIYALGQYDSGLAIVGRRSLLKKAGVRIPTSIDNAWTLAEFNNAMKKLQALDSVKYALDLKMNYGAGEWYTYAFGPVVQGFGGDLIDRATYQSSEGVLNGPEAVAAMKWIKSLFENGYSTLTPPDDNEFVNGNAAMGFVGHWMTTGYYKALGDDMVILPSVNFGARQATGMGSWAWSITSQCKNPEAAWEFLEYMLTPEEILSITNTNGAVPGRFSALKNSKLFGEGGRLNIFVQQLASGIAVPRPITPGYPAVTTAFYKAMDNIIKGGDVQAELDTAVDTINKDIADHNGYPVQN